jgi:hypothetical protein
MAYKQDKPNKTTQATKKSEFNKRLNSLKSEYNIWKKGHQQMSMYIDPTRGIFDNNRTTIGEPIDHETLLDSHATFARDTAASGMHTIMNDPAGSWFEIRLDEMLMDVFPNVKIWLDEVKRRMLVVLNKTNVYEVLFTFYKELLQFGTACFLILEDMDDVIRARSFTCGEYFLGVDCKGRVNAFAREFNMTVGQLVEQFGIESVSENVKADWDNGSVDKLHKVRHLIEANDNKKGGMEDFMNMPFRSIYWEATNDSDVFLRTGGLNRFRVIAGRWETVTTEMVYGYGPGWHAIGDIKELQVTHKDMLLAQELIGNPPLQKDSNVQGNIANVPGGVTTVSSNMPNAGVRPLYQVNPNLESFNLSIDRLHKKIDKFFFADLFLMINSMDAMGGNIQKTAYEIAERKAEKMMMLGPIGHKLTEEVHDNLIEILFYDMLENGLLPEVPQEIEGQELRVRYMSIFAQAQRAQGVNRIEKVLGFVGNSSALYPEAPDMLDIDEVIKEVSDMEGLPAKLLRDPELVAEIRAQKAQQQAIMAGASVANSAADTTKKLADSKMVEPSALTGLTKGYQ